LFNITAFAPDKGEFSFLRLIQNPPPGAPVPPILPPQDGFLFLDNGKFRAFIRRRLDADKAAFMADSQVPWAVEALRRREISEAGMEDQAELDILVATEGQDDSTAGQRFMSGSARVQSRRGGRQPTRFIVSQPKTPFCKS